MHCVLKGAEQMNTEDAYSFLVRFARQRKNRICAFPPGLVIDLARVHGIELRDERNWGPVFQQAARDGVIRPDGLFRRSSSNRSLRPGWIGA